MKYKIVEDITILHNGKPYKKGDEIDLSADEAARIGIYAKRIEKASEPVQDEPVAEQAVTEEASADKADTAETTKKRRGK